MKKILIIEDDLGISGSLKLYLENSWFEVILYSTWEKAIEFIKETLPDLIILDLNLPWKDWIEITKELRETDNTPIVMLTARTSELDKIRWLEIWADDYVAKPFSPRELLARIKALSRRTKKTVDHKGVFEFEDLKINYSTYEVFRGETLISLSKREFELLDFLVLNKGIVLSRDKILEEVWGFDYIGNDNILDLYIKYLRDKVDKPYERKFIQTVRGIGFIFK